MTDYGRILNTEVLDRIKLSEKLSPFRKQRQGTEIFIFDNRIMVSIYDDYSTYHASWAKKWTLKVYNRRTGTNYDKICINKGTYPIRERALEEMERFRERAEELIFYLLPVGFQFSLHKLIWREEDAEQGLATIEEQREEAIKRLWYLTSRKPTKDFDITKKKLDRVERAAVNTMLEADDKVFPYAVTDHSYHLVEVFYVGVDKASWANERNFGRFPVFCFFVDRPELNRFTADVIRCNKDLKV